MNPNKIRYAMYFAREFLQKGDRALKRHEADSTVAITGCKETAACRRASMDLTRALAEMRKGKNG